MKAVEIAERIADALEAAHEQGVIHRDVKSGNVMVTRQGTVKVMDFGIARIAENTDNVTQTAAVLGTASYLSPEQAQGRPVDARSDIYSLGIVLYEMLTGGPPFTGDTPVAIAYRHVHETPAPPSAKNPDVPPALDAVVMRALAKNPANRYATAAEFRMDLERVRRGEPVEATPLLPGGSDATQLISRPATMVLPPSPEHDKGGRRLALGVLIGALVLLALGGGLYLVAQSLLGGNAKPTPTPVPYPNILGEREQRARQDLATAGFRNIFVKRPVLPDPTDARIGTVIRQDPPGGGTLIPSQQVTIFVARGPTSVTIPSGLVGEDVRTASTQLRQLGLNPVVQQETSDQTPGTVLTVDPPEGSTARVGSDVTLTVAAAPKTVIVPDVTCESFGSAKHDLRSLGLNPVTSDQTRPLNPLCPTSNRVAEQDPAGNTQAHVGDTVTLYVGELTSPSPS